MSERLECKPVRVLLYECYFYPIRAWFYLETGRMNPEFGMNWMVMYSSHPMIDMQWPVGLRQGPPGPGTKPYDSLGGLLPPTEYAPQSRTNAGSRPPEERRVGSRPPKERIPSIPGPEMIGSPLRVGCDSSPAAGAGGQISQQGLRGEAGPFFHSPLRSNVRAGVPCASF